MKTNKLNPKIGVIGKGFVGSAVAHGFSDACGYNAQIKIYDKDPSRSLNSFDETVNESDFIFISVPTPARSSGNIDLSIVESLVKEIESVNKNEKNIILLRSTVTPGTTKKFVNNFPSLRFVFNPEFLTERSATFDFLNQSRIILGGHNENTSKVANLYKDRFGGHLPVIQTSFQTAELIKYMNNLFFATKVSFLNEMFEVAKKVDANWDEAIEGFVLDGRVGFGGSCFPKDIQAFISFGEEIGVDMQVLKGAWQTNLNVRPERDWEKLEGRAVSSSKK